MTKGAADRAGRPASRAVHLALVAIGCVLSLQCASCVIGRVVWFNVPNLGATKYFDERVVRASTRPRPYARRAVPAAFDMRESRNESYATFEDLLFQNDTRALLVLHHDEIVYERYFGDFTADTLFPCFSASKTFAAVLVGCALDDGLIPSVTAPLETLVPEAGAHPGYGAITLEQLLRMTSGIDFTEESLAGAVLYYTEDLRAETFAYDLKYPPGRHYEYGSIDLQLAWEVLHEKLGKRTVASYFQERVWNELGAEHDAEWALDSAAHGVEKLGAGFAATVRDYARLGMLFQHGGRVGDVEVVSEKWVRDSLAVDEVAGTVRTSDGPVRRGRYQWFLTLDGGRYFAKGYNGQYLFVDPARDVVVVRVGEGYGDVDWLALFGRVAQSL
jgi:CubicO group peptidase (beta-lactamase class C family)